MQYVTGEGHWGPTEVPGPGTGGGGAGGSLCQSATVGVQHFHSVGIGVIHHCNGLAVNTIAGISSSLS